jgi:hypothetical protein
MPTARASSRRGRERRLSRGIAAALFVMGSCWVHLARATGETIALVHPPGTDDVFSEITTRLRAELDAAGFDVEELVASAPADLEEPVATGGLPRTPRATVVVSGEDGIASVDIWVPDQKTHELAVRHVEAPPVARQRAPSVLAVRTVELLRAALLGPAASEAASRKPAPKPTPPKVDAAGPERRRVELGGEIGAAMLYGGHGISPAFAPMVRLQIGNGTWGGRLNVVAPAFGAEARAQGGKAVLRQELLSLDATVTWPAEGTFAVVAAAGGGGYHWHVSGEGVAPNVGHDADRWGAVAQAGAGALLRLGAHLGFMLDAQALWLAPPLVVRVAGVDAGKSGEPTLSASAGLWGTL